jgi:RNA polymerase sigma factor (sigma-70 family)
MGRMGDVAAKEKKALDSVDPEMLLRQWEPLARRLAHRFDWAADREDLEQAGEARFGSAKVFRRASAGGRSPGRLALLQAARRFDGTRGSQFSSFAVPTIVGELCRYVRDQALTVRIPRRWWDLRKRLKRAMEEMEQELGREPTAPELAERLGVDEEDVAGALGVHEFCHHHSLDEPAEDSEGETMGSLNGVIGAADPLMEAVEGRIAIRQAMAELPVRLRRILARRYFEGRSQREVGEDLGLVEALFAGTAGTGTAACGVSLAGACSNRRQALTSHPATPDARGPSLHLRPHDQHRTVSVPQDLLRDTAEQKALHCALPV